jgi:N-acetylglutamate synthase-like GNAT family acetyltransferase
MRIPVPSGIVIREAVREDERAIRAMVRLERLNPLGVDWRNFLVAVDPDRRIVGIGAVKRHGDGSREMASIAVAADWRGRGTAGALIGSILERESAAAGVQPAALHLICRAAMAPFYERFGFRKIGIGAMPPFFRRLYKLASAAALIFRLRNEMTVMKREANSKRRPGG